MWSKFFLILFTLFIAFTILFASVLRTASVRYEISTAPSEDETIKLENETVNYYLAYPGRVLPDSPLWPLKALRDRIWLFITTDKQRVAEIKLLFADKRLGASLILFKKGKASLGHSTLTKAEKYLEEACLLEEEVRKGGVDTSEFLFRLSLASLKHYELIQNILETAPEELKPPLLEIQEYPKKSFERARNGLLDKGKVVPVNPYCW